MVANPEIIVDVNRAVLAVSSPLATSLVVQYDMMGSITITYTNNPPIKVQVPSSSAVNCLVTISIKNNPVMIVEIPTAKEIKPEYVTRIPDNFLNYHILWFFKFIIDIFIDSIILKIKPTIKILFVNLF